MDFSSFFQMATGNPPYPYQSRLAEADRLPKLLMAPTGAGKTEAAILAAWLWRWLHHPDEVVRRATPRRLVYCLPMRTLVEQTRCRVQDWLARLGISGRVGVSVLMGGEEPDDRHLSFPEHMRILIGTQDMLLSRALNRGYASSPFKWPWEFGLLNNDCLWILDELQLMENGLPTSTQLQAFREALGTYRASQTLWMSATVQPQWLATVDFESPSPDQVLSLTNEDFRTSRLEERRTAAKRLRRLDLPGQRKTRSDQPYDYAELATEIQRLHRPGTRTLVVVNTVPRAQGVYQALDKLKASADTLLVHSRFRPKEREALNAKVTAAVSADSPGRIVVATQAIEAGVDISAGTLVTDLAPWPSVVQRLGRCNRAGEFDDSEVYWVDFPDIAKQAAPYDEMSLAGARERLLALEGQSAAPANLPDVDDGVVHRAVIRRRDLLGLFDTTPDLSGNYLDVSRYVRGTDENDVHVFWRKWDDGEPPADMPAPTSAELCGIPLNQKLRDYLRQRYKGRQAWHWDALDRQWRTAYADAVFPGQTLLLRSEAGGYDITLGWDASVRTPVTPVESGGEGAPLDDVGSDSTSTRRKRWVTLAQHSQDVEDEVRLILDALVDAHIEEAERRAVLTAARWHDAGKAHPVFQATMLSKLDNEERASREGEVWAKRGATARPDAHERTHFRHELASALAVLNHAPSDLDGPAIDLAAYLAAAHHGKLRLGIRSLPVGGRSPDHRYLLGLPVPDPNGRSGDAPLEELPSLELGEGLRVPATRLDLSIARLGVTEAGERSWLERTLSLREQLGPFRLAFLEALVRAADVRASIKEEQLAEGGVSHAR